MVTTFNKQACIEEILKCTFSKHEEKNLILSQSLKLVTEILFYPMFHVFQGGCLITTMGNRLVDELRDISEILQMSIVAIRMRQQGDGRTRIPSPLCILFPL